MSGVIHRSKFMQGRMTPFQAWQLHLVEKGGRCGGCKKPPAMEARVFSPIKEALENAPELMVKLAAAHDGNVPLVPFKTGPHVLVFHGFACGSAHCQKELRKVVGSVPSYCAVELDYGPGEEKPVVSVL